MSLANYLKMKKDLAAAQNKMDVDSKGRLTASMFHEIFSSEKQNITHRLKYIQKDLTTLV